ncbi:MAG: hypothetical protein A3K68_03985 [Euryarchaeota archaeon RBG_16_68_13]|nr:MAG: hypothetical protein A3K68_03985 [Euryarchaeota archaeon RBG_16_68_13]
MKLALGPRGVAILVVVGIVVLGLLGWMVLAYNGLVAKDQTVLAQWAQVENQYQRKIDLIPQLVAVTSQYQQFEQSLLTNITELRSRWQNATSFVERVNITNALDVNLFYLVATYEAYPTLSSIEVVRDLFFSLEGTENRITVERSRYNDAVRVYNTQIRSFPDLLIAGMFGFQDRPLYDPIPGGP